MNRDGVARQVGDSWSQDGCNNCRCLPSGVPGCTRRICSDREFWEEGRTCSEGKTWEEKTGEDLKVCTCTKGSPSCTDKVVKVASTSTSQCGEDSEGNPRLVGDSWKEECNNCRCTSTGVPVCTLRFCVNREEHECVDEQGNRRQHLEMWEEWEEAWEEEERSSGIEVNGNHKDCSCAQCVKPVTFSQVSVLPKLTLLSCHLGRPESRSKACLSCSSHFDPFYGQKVPKMAINAVFWP